MLTTVGLSSKNAILIITFAKDNLSKGMDLVEATMLAVRIRLRPILMTSLAFGLGVLPLAIATGAGSGAQRAIGTGVVGGMLAGTFLGIFFIPLFFVAVRRLTTLPMVLDEVIVDDKGGRMFVCSDTDFCAGRQAEGHRGRFNPEAAT